MKQRFLCPKHRESIFQYPEQAKEMCSKLRLLGRHQVGRGRCNEAVALFGNAFETAEILLCLDTSPQQAAERYLKIALEFIYVLRKSAYPVDFEALIAQVKWRLEKEKLSGATDMFFTLLADIAFSPALEVDTWMQLLFAQDIAKIQTKH